MITFLRWWFGTWLFDVRRLPEGWYAYWPATTGYCGPFSRKIQAIRAGISYSKENDLVDQLLEQRRYK